MEANGPVASTQAHREGSRQAALPSQLLSTVDMARQACAILDVSVAS